MIKLRELDLVSCYFFPDRAHAYAWGRRGVLFLCTLNLEPIMDSQLKQQQLPQSHHKQAEIATDRPSYREARRERAVKV